LDATIDPEDAFLVSGVRLQNQMSIGRLEHAVSRAASKILTFEEKCHRKFRVTTTAKHEVSMQNIATEARCAKFVDFIRKFLELFSKM